MPTAAQYDLILADDTAALTAAQAEVNAAASMPRFPGVHPDGITFNAVNTNRWTTTDLGQLNRARDAYSAAYPKLVAAKAKLAADQALRDAAAFTEAQLAANFSALQSAAGLQGLSDITATPYLPSYRGAVLSSHLSLPAISTDQYDNLIDLGDGTALIQRKTQSYIPMTKAIGAEIMRKYFAGMAVFFNMLGGVWRAPPQESALKMSALVYSQTDGTQLIKEARAALGAPAFDADPVAGIDSFLRNLAHQDGLTTLAEAIKADSISHGSFFSDPNFVKGVVAFGGIYAVAQLSASGSFNIFNSPPTGVLSGSGGGASAAVTATPATVSSVGMAAPTSGAVTTTAGSAAAAAAAGGATTVSTGAGLGLSDVLGAATGALGVATSMQSLSAKKPSGPPPPANYSPPPAQDVTQTGPSGVSVYLLTILGIIGVVLV